MTPLGTVSRRLHKKLSRRRLLRGAIGGATVTLALPILESFGGLNQAHGSGFPLRLGLFTWGNGMLPERWIPVDEGPNWTLSDQLQPLVGVRDEFSLLTGLNHEVPNTIPHFSGLTALLSGAAAIEKGGEEYTFAAPTVDQVVAELWGAESRFPALEFGCDVQGSTSYLGPDQPVPLETSPRALFERVFGGAFRAPGEQQEADPRLRLRRSILAGVLDDLRQLRGQVSASDRARLELHTESVRSLERQLARLEEAPPSYAGCRRPEEPIPPNEESRLRLRETHRAFTEILILALACDQTRVWNECFTRPLSNYLYPGASQGHHRLTHDEPGDQPEVHAIMLQIMEELAYLIDRLASIPEGDQRLIDHCALIACSEISRGRNHSLEEIPILTIGSAGGRLQRGIHYRSPAGERCTQAFLSVLRALGLPFESWGAGENIAREGLSILSG